jgi:hypothetical protein
MLLERSFMDGLRRSKYKRSLTYHIKGGRGGERRDRRISLGGMGTDGWRGVQTKNEERQTRCITNKREERRYAR